MKKANRCVILLAFFCFSSFAQVEDSLAEQVETLNQAYKLNLYPKHDPFARIFSIEQGKKTFGRMMLRRKPDGSQVESSMAKINKALFSFDRDAEMDVGLLQAIIADGQTWLASFDKHPLIELQANRLALELAQDYLRRFGIIKKHQASGEEEDGSQSSTEEKKSSASNSSPPPPEYPELPEDYEPGTNELGESGEGGESQEKYVAAQVDMRTAYFGMRYFSEIIDHGKKTSFHQVDLHMAPRVLSSVAPKGSKTLTVYPAGKFRGGLFLPPGYEPRQSADPRVHIEAKFNGSFTFELTEALDQFQIPIVKASPKLSPMVEEAHKRPAGIEKAQWPTKIRAPLFTKYDPNTDQSHRALEIASWIQQFVSKKYIYSTANRPEKTATSALEAGAFQCDMAALIMASLMRDVYQIPTRIVAGYRAKELRTDKSEQSYLVLPGDAHAWVEVYANGVWNLFDPTPITKDKEDDGSDGGQKDPYSDVVDDDGEEDEGGFPPSRERPDGESPEGQGDESEASDESGEASDSDESSSGEGKKSDAEGENGDKDGDGENGDSEDKEDGNVRNLDQRELADQLEMGSVSLKDEHLDNRLLERAYRSTLRFVLEPSVDGITTMDRLVSMGGLFRAAPDALVKSTFLQALSIHAKNHPDLVTWLEESRGRIKDRSLADTYREVFRAKQVLDLYASTLGSETPVKPPTKLLRDLGIFLDEIRDLAHPDSDDIGLAKAFYDSLPPLAGSLVQEKFGLNSIGANAPTMALAEELKKPGGLADLKLLAGLSGVSEFILDSTPRPEYQPVKTWIADTSGGNRNDLLPLTRYSELPRSLLLNPGRSLEENLQDGTVFSHAKRKRVLIPTGFGEEDTERVTILLYDTSGSMSGDLAYFQSALISSFVSQALSDVSPSGAFRHKVVLVPFDHDVHPETKVTTRAEAIEVLRTYKDSLGNTGGGTDIQKAMMQGLALIADAELRVGEPLAAANIVLMSDGYSDVNLDELREARNAIDRSTPLQSMFVAIGGGNEQLMQFAQESKNMGFERGFYRQFAHGDIEKNIAKSREKTVADPNHIYTEKRARHLSREALNRLDSAITGAYHFRTELNAHGAHKMGDELLEAFEQELVWNDVDHEDRLLEEWLKELRGFAYNRVFKDKALLARVLDELLGQFKALTNLTFKQLSDGEIEHLRHLLAYAAGEEL